MNTKNLTFAYWGTMGLALIAIFLPWFTVSASVLGISHSESVLGIGWIWGILAFLGVLAGGGLSLVGPARLLKANTKIMMAGAGALVAVCALIAMLIGFSRGHSDEVKELSAIGSFSAGPGIGDYIALIAGLVAGAVGWMLDWTQVQPMFKIAAVEARAAGFPVMPVQPTGMPPAAQPPVGAPPMAAPPVAPIEPPPTA